MIIHHPDDLCPCLILHVSLSRFCDGASPRRRQKYRRLPLLSRGDFRRLGIIEPQRDAREVRAAGRAPGIEHHALRHAQHAGDGAQQRIRDSSSFPAAMLLSRAQAVSQRAASMQMVMPRSRARTVRPCRAGAAQLRVLFFGGRHAAIVRGEGSSLQAERGGGRVRAVWSNGRKAGVGADRPDTLPDAPPVACRPRLPPSTSWTEDGTWAGRERECWRGISPRGSGSTAVGSVADAAYTWLIAHADNLGRFHGEPEQVKAMVMPRRKDVTSEDVEKVAPRTPRIVPHHLAQGCWPALCPVSGQRLETTSTSDRKHESFQ